MSKLRIISPNQVRETGVTIEDTTFNVASLPATNLLSPVLAVRARSATGGASQHVTFDMGAAASVRGVAILGHTIPNLATLRVAGHSANTWTAPDSGWLTLTHSLGPITGWFASTQSYRYWRVEIDASAQFDIGAIVLGPYWEAPHDGYASLRRSSRYYRGHDVTVQTISAALEWLTQANAAELMTILDRHRERGEGAPYHWGSEPGLFAFDPLNEIDESYLNIWSLYGVFAGDPTGEMGPHTRERYELTIEECK